MSVWCRVFWTLSRFVLSVWMRVSASRASIETGGVLYEHNTKGRIATVKGNLAYHLFVAIELPDGRQMEAADLLNTLGAFVELVLTIVQKAWRGEP